MDNRPFSQHTGPLIKRLNTGIETHMNNVAAEMDLTGTQIHLLHYVCLHYKEQLTQVRLEEIFSLSHATLSGIVSRLLNKEFLYVRISEQDKRIKYLYPTQKAFDCDNAMHSRIKACESALAAGFSEEELEMLRQYLERMIANVDNIQNTEEQNNA